MNKIIDGKKISQTVINDLKIRTRKLKKSKIVPCIAILQVGSVSDASNVYILQKKRVAKELGIKVIHTQLPITALYQDLAEEIHRLNFLPGVHGIIIQRPLPPTISTTTLNTAIAITKDIDGFQEKSSYNSPIALAVMELLRNAFDRTTVTPLLKTKQILLIGKGETAGQPIANYLTEKKIPFLIANSQTENITEFAQESDIIISCVGKPNIVKSDMIKEGAVLISVGIYRDASGRLHGDYTESQVAEKAGKFTPTPGGVGPVTLAFLFRNLLNAAEKTITTK
jgi:methylenetetrahydrofolate dehydrogenase (NADP+)/methenyltetrahydrofolate cyclohydrolase